ncbi:hypothetical protein Acr_16g0010460 [Actinidia rufa]|uniref:Uncharacterized protein n=1 Tax=Actinidia rufa TaxID=165716 RepID=A0A7J0G0F4_9ERIC|nr:hypothetical protein Acr_16g0010460 [Actinidia rufa]
METFTLARPVFNGVFTEFWRRKLSSLLHRDSSTEALALARLAESSYMTSGPRVLFPRLFWYQDWFEAVGGSVSCPLALNRARLLVHDDEALERFRAIYGIPTNVIIEHPGPNEVARIVEDNVDHISIHIWLIYQAELRFPISTTVQGRREDITSSSSSYTSLNSFDDNEEEKKEADSQLVLNRRRGRLIPMVEPENPTLSISILNSNNKHSDDLARALPQLVRGDEIVGLNSVEVNIIRDHDTNMALARAVMLPNDIIALSEETSEIMRSLLVMQHIQAWDASYASATQAQDKATTTEAGDNYNKQVIKVFFESFLEGWLACLSELGIPKDNPTWVKATPAPEFPESHDEEDIPDPVMTPSDEVAHLEKGTEGIAANGSKEKSAEEAGEDATQERALEL